MENVSIRIASPDDAEKLLAIYAPYVEKTAITFEYDVPTVHEFRKRMEQTLERYPYLVAAVGDEIVGYAYTGSFVGRAAYDHSAETSIYVDENYRHGGIGKRLYEAIEEISAAQNIINLYACIGYPEVEDEHLLNKACRASDRITPLLQRTGAEKIPESSGYTDSGVVSARPR